jgi:hypothetical protein
MSAPQVPLFPPKYFTYLAPPRHYLPGNKTVASPHKSALAIFSEVTGRGPRQDPCVISLVANELPSEIHRKSAALITFSYSPI